jgi:hypothetical protein
VEAWATKASITQEDHFASDYDDNEEDDENYASEFDSKDVELNWQLEEEL